MLKYVKNPCEKSNREEKTILCHLGFNFKNGNLLIKTIVQVSEYVDHLLIIARAEDKPVILAQSEMNLDV